MDEISLTMDQTGWLAGLQMELDGAIADLMQVCQAAEAQTYSNTASEYRVGLARIGLPNAQALANEAPARAARSCFLAAIGKFIGFMDKLIATQNISKEKIVVTRDLCGEDEILGYMNEYLGDRIRKVAHDQSMTNPKKLDRFAGITNFARDAMLSYFQFRRALEHHQDIPSNDLTVPMQRPSLFVEGVEVTSLPFDVKGGNKVEVRIATEHKVFPAGRKVILTPPNALDMLFVMRNVAAIQVFRVHLGEPAIQ